MHVEDENSSKYHQQPSNHHSQLNLHCMYKPCQTHTNPKQSDKNSSMSNTHKIKTDGHGTQRI